MLNCKVGVLLLNVWGYQLVTTLEIYHFEIRWLIESDKDCHLGSVDTFQRVVV